MCADASTYARPAATKPQTPGQLLDAELEAVNRENAELRQRVADIEAELSRARRHVDDPNYYTPPRAAGLGYVRPLPWSHDRG